MKTLLTLAATSVLGAAVLIVAPANAAPSTATQTVPLACDNGATGTAQVDSRGLPSRSAWLDGRGVAARAFARAESGTVELVDGTLVPYVVDEPAGGDSGRQGIHLVRNPVSLSNTTACRIPVETFELTLTLAAEDVAFIGVAPSYIGTQAHVVGSGSTTVYIGTAQLGART